MKKISVVIFAVLIGLGFYSFAGWFGDGITFSKVMSVVGLIIVATFVERRYSFNEGIWLVLEILRDALGGLGSLSIVHLLPVDLSESMSVVVMLASTAILAITVSDYFGEDENNGRVYICICTLLLFDFV